MRAYLALIIAAIVLVGVSVVADNTTITKNLGALVPGDVAYYDTEFSVWDSNPATWEILYSGVVVNNGFVAVNVYTKYLDNYLFSIEFKDNKQLILSYTDNHYYHDIVLSGNYTQANKIIITYNAESLTVKLYNNNQLINSTTINNIAVQTSITKLGIGLIATNNPCTASGTITIYISYNTNTASEQVQQQVSDTVKTVTNTATTTLPPLMGLGVLLLGFKKIEEILSSLIR